MNYPKYLALLSSTLLVALVSSTSLPVIGSSVSKDILTKQESNRAVALTKKAKKPRRKVLTFSNLNVVAPSNLSSRFGGLRSESCKQQDDIIALLPADQKATDLNKSGKQQVNNITHLTADPYPIVLFYLPQNSPTQARFYLEEENEGFVYLADVQMPTNNKQNGIVTLNFSDIAKANNLPELTTGKNYSWKLKFICENKIEDIDKKSPEISGWIKRIDLNTSLKNQLGSSYINNQDSKDSDVISEQLNQTETKDYPSVYTNNGIWYSAVSSLAQLRNENPEDLDIKLDWETLLKSVKLEEISDKPIRGSATIQKIKVQKK